MPDRPEILSCSTILVGKKATVDGSVIAASSCDGDIMGVIDVMPARRYPAKYRVYCVIGDGEANEGQVWEAAASAAHHRLDNLTAILDHNQFQSTGATEKKLNMFSFAAKFQSFGWATREIDGNDISQILAALDWAKTVGDTPQAIIAHTLKGKGMPGYEGTNCHFVKITDDLLRIGQDALRG